MIARLFQFVILFGLLSMTSSCMLAMYGRAQVKHKKIVKERELKAMEEAKPFDLSNFKVKIIEFKDYSGDGKLSHLEEGYIVVEFHNASNRNMPSGSRALEASIISEDTSVLKIIRMKQFKFDLPAMNPGWKMNFPVYIAGGHELVDGKGAIKVVVSGDGQTKTETLREIELTSVPCIDLSFVSPNGHSVKSTAGKYVVPRTGAKFTLSENGTFEYTNIDNAAITGKWQINGVVSPFFFNKDFLDHVEFYDYTPTSDSSYFFYLPPHIKVQLIKYNHDAITLNMDYCMFSVEDFEGEAPETQSLKQLIIGGWEGKVSGDAMKFRFTEDNTYSYYSTERSGAGTGRWQIFSTKNKDEVVYHSLVLFGKDQKQKSNRYIIDDFGTSQAKIELYDVGSCGQSSGFSWFSLSRNDGVEIDLQQKLNTKKR